MITRLSVQRCLLALVVAIAVSLHADEDGSGLKPGDGKATDPKTEALREIEFGKKAMLDANTNAKWVVDAALAFAKALHYFKSVNDDDMVCELKADIFWCKKRMNIDDLNRFLAEKDNDPQNTRLAAEVEAEAGKQVESAQAQSYLESAIAFAHEHPEDAAQISSRYFEVAERFVGTEVGKRAQALSLDAQKRMEAEAQARHDAMFETIFTHAASLPAKDREPVPASDAVSKADSDLRKRFADDFDLKRPGQDRRLAAMLAKLSEEDQESPALRYAVLTEAATALRNVGNYYGLLTLAERMAAGFAVDAKTQKKAWLDPERSNPIAAAIISLLDTPLDKNANLIVGRYLCFEAHQWAVGIPVLAHGASGELKVVIDMELFKPAAGMQQVQLANRWYALGHSAAPGPGRDQMLARSCRWYETAYFNLSGITQKLADSRVDEIKLLLPYTLLNFNYLLTNKEWDRLPGKPIMVSAEAGRQDIGLVVKRGMHIQLLACPSDTWKITSPQAFSQKVVHYFSVNWYGYDQVANLTRALGPGKPVIGSITMSIEDGPEVRLGYIEGDHRTEASAVAHVGDEAGLKGLGHVFLSPFLPIGFQATGTIRVKILELDD